MLRDQVSEPTLGLDWFEAGEAVFVSGTSDPRLFPPLDDQTAQQEWLYGFAAAWAALTDGTFGETPPEAVDSVYSILVRRLSDKPELTVQLLRMTTAGSRLIH
jgi:hypothetical protein